MAVNLSLLNSNNVDNINTNFERVANALAETLGRDGSTPNQMNVDLDMNSNDILNISGLEVDSLIIDGQVATPNINLYVPADNSVGTSKIVDGAVTTAKLADNSVTQVKMADDSIGEDELIDSSVSYAKLGSSVISVLTGIDAIADVAFKNTFYKANPYAAAFQVKSGSGGQEIQIKAGSKAEVNGLLVEWAIDTDITSPSPHTAGRDYLIWLETTGAVRSVLWSETSAEWPNLPTYPPAPTANARIIGGYHYAPGGNATGYNTGGNTVPQINPYSIWDVKFKPACDDPRGMTLVANSFWCDIYLLNTQHSTLGTSRNNVAIAHGTVTPLIPALFNGDGTTTYPDFMWWRSADVYSAHGKQMLSYTEFMTAAYGVIEELTRTQLPATTGLGTTNSTATEDAKFISRFGVMNATGAHWVWGRELSYGIFEGGYNEPPDGTSVSGSFLSVVPEYRDPGLGRGWVVNENLRATRALLFGSKSNNGIRGGSVCLDMANAINTTSASISGRGRANHVVIL